MKFYTQYNPYAVLEFHGYNKLEDDSYVKKTDLKNKSLKKGERFHALVDGNIIDVHYDMVVIKKGRWFHKSNRKYWLVAKEIERLKKF